MIARIDIGFIKVIGKHYASVTMTPAISVLYVKAIVSNMKCKIEKGFYDKRREVYKFREILDDERQKIN